MHESPLPVWDATGDSHHRRLAMEKGRAELIQRADKISQQKWRTSFMTDVPEHRVLTQLYARQA